MKTRMTDAQKIERIAERHKDDGWNFYARYSGRCMFGAVCPGITCPPYDTSKVVSAVKKAGIKAYPSHDSMGRDCIVYWTGVEAGPERLVCPCCEEYCEALEPTSGVCSQCTEAAYDSYCPR